MITIKDIAEKSGVTATTVSRVINNRGYISHATREKVQRVMKEMNYQPNELARAMTKRSTNTIGVIVPHISHPFFVKLLSALEREAAEKHYKILLCNSRERREKEEEYLDMCVSNRVSGIVLCSKYVNTRDFRALHIPIVNLERYQEPGWGISICSNNYQGGRLAAEHLIECGCRKLLNFGCIQKKEMPADRRTEGFLEVCREAGVEAIAIHYDEKLYDDQIYDAYVRNGLETYPGVDGVFASSDLIAAEVIRQCSLMGKRVPQDVKVVGFDDVQIASIIYPSITTIHQPVDEMARRSVEYIDDIANGREAPGSVEMPVTLIKRESTEIKEL